MENETIFEAAQSIVRKETVSFSIKQYNDYLKKTSQTPKKEPTKVRSSRKK
jgi:hypothetical protein